MKLTIAIRVQWAFEMIKRGILVIETLEKFQDICR